MRRSFPETVAVIASVLLTLLCSLTEPAMSAPRRTFYVATTGNDTANGSVAAPWRTLKRAAQAVVPGDLIIVRPGRDADLIRVDVPVDREGNTRPMGPTSDIDAYEFRSTLDTTPPLAPEGFRLLQIQ